ncbi:MAG: hypothetical protein LIP28_03775 [Deltaproteobacteria bacterium]|nr:hypothetical protein [Deltaproteobacteria bacterium]
MDQANYQKLRFCAVCQNPCRILFPAGLQPRESRYCSAMAYLALAVKEGFVDFTPDVEARLDDLEGCKACKAACPHGVDTPALVMEVAREAKARKES